MALWLAVLLWAIQKTVNILQSKQRGLKTDTDSRKLQGKEVPKFKAKQISEIDSASSSMRKLVWVPRCNYMIYYELASFYRSDLVEKVKISPYTIISFEEWMTGRIS